MKEVKREALSFRSSAVWKEILFFPLKRGLILGVLLGLLLCWAFRVNDWRITLSSVLVVQGIFLIESVPSWYPEGIRALGIFIAIACAILFWLWSPYDYRLGILAGIAAAGMVCFLKKGS